MSLTDILLLPVVFPKRKSNYADSIAFMYRICESLCWKAEHDHSLPSLYSDAAEIVVVEFVIMLSPLRSDDAVVHPPAPFPSPKK